jgi:hypothetical protein
MIEAAIMAVPERRALVDDLKRRLKRDLRVFWDEVHIGHADAYKLAMDETARRALEVGASRAMIIEDDALPCQMFLNVANRAVHFVPPGDPVTFFTRNRAHDDGGHWLRLRGGFLNTQAVAWPVRAWFAVSDWMDSEQGRQWRTDHTWFGPPPMPKGCMREVCIDNWWSPWMRRHGVDAWATIPSLVDHRQERSIIPHHHIGVATSFIGEDDPFLVDWRRGAPKPRSNRRLRSVS